MDTLNFIGNATTLLKIGEVNILIDPSFFHGTHRVHMGWGLFSRRLIPPVTDKLLEVQLVLLTHTHKDHFDDEAVELLRDMQPTVITNPSDMGKLRKAGFSDVRPITSETTLEFDQFQVIGIPARHGPIFLRPFVGAVTGFGIETGKGKLWISGDTIGTSDLKERLKVFLPDVAIPFFGGVKYLGFSLTFDERSAFEMIDEVESIRRIFPIHVDDWSHFNTTPEKIRDVFQENSKIEVIFPPRGKEISIWT